MNRLIKMNVLRSVTRWPAAGDFRYRAGQADLLQRARLKRPRLIGDLLE